MASNIASGTNNDSGRNTLVPPQLPPFLANLFNLKPIVGNPTHEEVRLVHEAARALNNFSHMPELRDTDLSTELSQHLFDIQMACHRQKYPIDVLPNNIVYDPPVLPNYIPVELKSVTGPPSNEEIASVHTALRISESFVNVPSIFDSDAHIQLSQHLFDLQFARHVERSIVKRFTSAIPAPHNQTTSHPSPDDTSASNRPAVQVPSDATLQETTESTETQSPALEQPNPSIEAPSHPNPNESNEIRRNNELMVEIRDTLQRMNRVLVGTQNSLARGFNSSAIRSAYYSNGISHDLGAHSLINDYGEVPETYNLPTFKAGTYHVEFAINDLTENILARYLRFYNMGEELIEEGEELKIKSGMIDNARNLLSVRLFLIR